MKIGRKGFGLRTTVARNKGDIVCKLKGFVAKTQDKVFSELVDFAQTRRRVPCSWYSWDFYDFTLYSPDTEVSQFINCELESPNVHVISNIKRYEPSFMI